MRLREKTRMKYLTAIQGKLMNQYLKVKTIGEGTYSKIKLMLSKPQNRKYAMKKYNLFILRKKTRMQKTRKEKVKFIG